MYAVMKQESKTVNHNNYPVGKGKAFFLSKPVNNKTDVKIVVSKQVSNSVSRDIKKAVNIMANNIIEGLIHDKR